jgi:hypothetical protein
MSVDLAEFLLARIALDEEFARNATESVGDGTWSVSYDNDRVPMLSTAGSIIGRRIIQHVARHAARFDPARVLAECDAQRQIIEKHIDPTDSWDCPTCARPEGFSEDADGNREYSRSAVTAPCPTLRLLALPYAGHPGYREEWRP